MLAGPDHEAVLEEVTRMPEETPLDQETCKVCHILYRSVNVWLQSKALSETVQKMAIAL